MDQREPEACDENRPDRLASWRNGEQSAEEIELEKGLLNECPSGVGDEDDEDFPIKNSLGNGGPATVVVAENCADEKEDEGRWNGNPEDDFYAVFE